MQHARSLRSTFKHVSRREYQTLNSVPLLIYHRHVSRIVFRTPKPYPQLSHRLFSKSTQVKQESSTTFPDPERADLWYHLFEPPNPASTTNRSFALSLISTPPSNPRSETIVGWLPAEQNSGQEQEAGLNDFVENRAFLSVLHQAVKQGLAEGVDDIQINAATQLGEGWMHINDQRNVPALGRIGDPDDILGSVRVENGKIMADTYEAMPAYRLCTADGVIQLTEGLASKLREVLERRAQAELSGK